VRPPGLPFAEALTSGAVIGASAGRHRGTAIGPQGAAVDAARSGRARPCGAQLAKARSLHDEQCDTRPARS
jgi:hypothetical protein